MKALPGRTWNSISGRLRRFGVSTLQGTYTLNGIVRATGYEVAMILRAKEALSQKWKGRIACKSYKAGRKVKSWFLINEEQKDELVAYLADEPYDFLSPAGNPKRKWALYFDKCQKCGTNRTEKHQRHHAKGLCSTCHRTHLRVLKRLEPQE